MCHAELKQTIGQVIHPFYVFQIASIILWSLDDYFYYAFCIALISVVSITTTLIDTRKAGQFQQHELTICSRRLYRLSLECVNCLASPAL
jgi:hypothetical protein